ncbi:uncharacterized protein NPIL_619791 [Nephila pilipes]|uniref:Uncharacterized protein n=1 Tax=Nephila pilipes TaxID=299642 RepID=A0A8X6NJY9_NEPPI|nr:uncharacterized protein NPIL_619791 [Nephila pilipes]
MDNHIIHKVLSNKILKDAIENLCEPGVLNLIDEKWMDILKNSPVWQKHETVNAFGRVYVTTDAETKIPISKQYVLNSEDNFDVLVVGYFKTIATNNAVKQSYCKPLDEIGNLLCKNKCLPSNFFINSCNGICPSCRKFDTLRNNKWCLKDTKVYTPEGIKNASKSYIQTIFKTSDLAIARLVINMKYTFNNYYKIGGRVKSIVFIQESLLREDSEEMREVLTTENAHFVPTQLPEVDVLTQRAENSVLAIPQEMKEETTFQVQSTSM